jgi:putative FmdB family regulatory protein
VPTYQYRCTECGVTIDVVQSFHDDPITECAVCQGTMRKVFSPVGVLFKGSGFYRTDSRTAADGTVAGSSSGSAAGASSSTAAPSPASAGTSAPAGSSGSGSTSPDATP